MAVTPQSSITICSGVPWSNDGQNFRAYTSKSARNTAIAAYRKFPVLSNFSYVREDERHPIRVPIKKEELDDCNYLYYTNYPATPTVEQRVYFCFIDEVKYVNEGTSLIYFTEDWFQTWYYDMVFNACFVEREHATESEDTVGENTLAEPVSVKSYYTTNETRLLEGVSNQRYIGIFLLSEKVPWVTTITRGIAEHGVGHEEGDARATSVGGVPSAAYWTCTHKGTIQQVAEDIATTIEVWKSENIAPSVVKQVYVVRADFVDTESVTMTVQGAAPTTETFDVIKPTRFFRDQITGASMVLPRDSDGDFYKPTNAKTKTSPFVFLELTTGYNTVNLAYELFAGRTTPKFQVEATAGTDGGVLCRPQGYLGLYSDIDNAIQLKSSIAVPYILDAQTDWFAKNGTSLLIKTATNVLGAAASGYITGQLSGSTTIGVISGIAGAVSAIATTGATHTQVHNTPDAIGGTLATGEVSVCEPTIGALHTRCKCAKLEYLKIVDNFFDMFGYNVAKIKLANGLGVSSTTKRPLWNFIKTQGAQVHGEVPSEVMRNMENALNAGLTLWHNDDVGDYTDVIGNSVYYSHNEGVNNNG